MSDKITVNKGTGAGGSQTTKNGFKLEDKLRNTISSNSESEEILHEKKSGKKNDKDCDKWKSIYSCV